MIENTASLLPLHAMARQIGVTAKWLRAEAEAGRIPHLKAGARLLFHSVTVERLLQRRASARRTRQEARK
jgi:hypothetical protein